MNTIERIQATLALAPVDRPPVIPVMLMQGARMLDMPLRRYFGDPSSLTEGQLRLTERFDTDAVFTIPNLLQDTLPWGGDLQFHDDGPPTLTRMTITGYEEIASLRVPDATAHPYLRRSLETAASLKRQVGNDKLVVGAVVAPFSLPSLLMGGRKYMQLLLDPALRQQYHRPLMQKMIAYVSAWARAQLSAGCDLIVMADGMSSATILEEATFVSAAKPVIQACAEQVRGALAFEWVGDANVFMRHARDLPVAAIAIGGGDPVATARRHLGPSKALIGNLNNLHLLRWPPERVEFEARRAISEAGPGFMLAQGGPEVPWHVSDANVDALVRAARRTVVRSAT